MVVLVDDENRENEGDLVMAAEKATPEAVNFMTKEGRGIVCLAITEEKADALNLPLMAQDNTSKFGTAFTVSIDAAFGIATGVSAPDRSHTILCAVSDEARPEDFVRPGHLFPLRARNGGVLVRAGQTEGSVDLARLAGLTTAGVICEIMNEDGSMARLPQLTEFCGRQNLKLCSVADIISYRRQTERLVRKIVNVRLPTTYGKFDLHLYRSLVDEYLHLALCAGGIGKEEGGKVSVQESPALVRVHSECLTGDILGSLRCDCGDQLHQALRTIAAAGKGVLLYIRQEGRGIGLEDKLKSYALQEQGLDTVDANIHLGLPADLRDYGIGAQILFDLGVRKMRLLTNNPKKLVSLAGYGLEVVERVPIETVPNSENRAYLRAKKERMGHLLGENDEI
ncbi:MAG: bifunctional 3,4-dihydroxy-2-butanone 4-phosphate synthase/GTP cyclohydrolase II [Planctomycetes bacterium RBG_16_59_8]|nr:MAG: bifunctional 3,4-dihydroxy-2-butanone 4-phosphate synthase/GTP cyclohydrolase II [Planctomycetes bacterium RBG_16_59_8]